MIFSLKPIRKLLLGQSLSNAGFEAMGIELDEEAKPRLEQVSKMVFYGFNTAVEYGSGDDLELITSSLNGEMEGFFFEGAGMGLYALDTLSLFKKDRFFETCQGVAKRHESIMYVGAGIGMAVFGTSYMKFLKKADPFYGIQIFDGLGFYHAFKNKKVLRDFYVPKDIKANPRYLDCYDDGVGRALWFYHTTDPQKVAKAIAEFPEERHYSLWRGVGLASSYARGGTIRPEKYELLRKLSGKHLEWLSVGCFLAVAFRQMHCPAKPDYDPVIENALIKIGPEECYRKEREIYHECIANKESLHDYLDKIKSLVPKELIMLNRTSVEA